MPSQDIITTILTSTAVSTLIAAVIKLHLEDKFKKELQEMEHKYEIELKLIKNKLYI